MVEGLGWAGMNEVPLVITHYQRGGPATGQPTRHEQGDLKFILSAAHGEFPRIVLCSGDMEESFYDAIRIFNYAERFQDRKSTRLNSSHRCSSYAVFCLKKK